jgi:hypothetical protein
MLYKRLISVAALSIAASLLGTIAPLQAAPASGQEPVVAERSASTDLSAQSRKRRGPMRLRVYPGYAYPGPNAVRQCAAHYVQERRQSGTVIVPRMHCRWQRS